MVIYQPNERLNWILLRVYDLSKSSRELEAILTIVKHILILIFITNNISGQVAKPVQDTIDYTYLLRIKERKLIKVLDNNIKSLYNCNQDLWFWTPLDISEINRTHSDQVITLNPTDTLMNIWWYISKNSGCIKGSCGHDDYIWRLKLNKESNLMLLDRWVCKKEKMLSRLFFKVIKCSEFEIILEDTQIKSVKRRYYFQKK